MKEFIKKCMVLLVIVPLIIGTVGYTFAGAMISDALYSSFALYFTNPISDAYNIYIEIARWTAPLVTATTILYVIKDAWKSINWRISVFNKKDSIAVYSDENCEISTEKNIRVIYPGEKFKSYIDNHIILFSDDKKSLQFYKEHFDEKYKDKKVYIGIRDIESSFLQKDDNETKNQKNKNIYFFDINMAIARIFWKNVALWNDKDKKTPQDYNIIIYGDNNLTRSITYTGLQLNLISLKQNINYYIITENELLKLRYGKVKLMNNDKLIFCKKSDSNIWDIISNANLLIITENIQAELLQTIIVKAEEADIHYYSPRETDFVSYISCERLKIFGRRTEIFTDDNIRKKKLIEKAEKLNEAYAKKHNSEDDWESLPEFLKASNISASDFGEVLMVLNNKMDEDEMANLEHIRWCRFYFLNYYKYGIPDNNKNKDDKKRIHKDLVYYNELSEEEKIKDKDGVRTILELYNKNNCQEEWQ